MLRDHYYNIETQFFCDDCNEAVTNPICPHCMAIQIEAWLTLYPNLRREILPRLRKYLKKIENKIGDSTQCIKCRNKRASICPYCFTANTLKELKEIEANKRILKEFLEFFNFDFYHTDYTKEAEKLGVI